VISVVLEPLIPLPRYNLCQHPLRSSSSGQTPPFWIDGCQLSWTTGLCLRFSDKPCRSWALTFDLFGTVRLREASERRLNGGTQRKIIAGQKDSGDEPLHVHQLFKLVLFDVFFFFQNIDACGCVGFCSLCARGAPVFSFLDFYGCGSPEGIHMRKQWRHGWHFFFAPSLAGVSLWISPKAYGLSLNWSVRAIDGG